MNDSFLDHLIQRYYPKSAVKIQEVLATTILLDKLATSVYSKLDNYVQKYADIADRIKSLINIAQDWQRGAYRTISYKNISIGVFVLIYFVNPYDFIPDFIPFIGKKDDDFFVKKGLVYLDEEIEKYNSWKLQNDVFV